MKAGKLILQIVNFCALWKRWGKRAVHSFPAGDSASSGEGRRAGVGQCAAGRRCDRIKVRGYKAEPHDS